MEALEQVLKFVGAVVLAGGGVSLIAYQAFKHLAARWLDSKFDERLQALRHAHGKELEQLRFKIAALLDRTTKLHQKEFELLPEAWSKLNDAFWEVRAFVSPMQAYADIDRMTPPQQEEFIEGSRLTSWQKDELRKSDQKKLLPPRDTPDHPIQVEDGFGLIPRFVGHGLSGHLCASSSRTDAVLDARDQRQEQPVGLRAQRSAMAL